MLYLRLARGGVVEIMDAISADLDDDILVLKAANGRVVGRFERLDVVAYSPRRELLETKPDEAPLPLSPSGTRTASDSAGL